jgi:hypothetical protein
VSEQPTAAPARPAGRENVFTHKIGPLPMWGWLAIVGGALVAWRLYSGKQAAAANTAGTTTGTSAGTDPNTVPQFVNQTYVNTTAPAAPTGTPTGGTPTNPAPVGSSGNPKPTTTLPGAWSYPAPTGLQVYDQASKGIRLSWNAVTGPSGQHPNSYNVTTYNSKGKQVSQHNTTAGNTNTAEYGPGGKGLPKGTYHTVVWANGGPVAPKGATVQYTLTA